MTKGLAVLYSQWQQAISENNEYERFMKLLLASREKCLKVPGKVVDRQSFVKEFEEHLEEFRRRMKPVRAMRKARPE